MVNMSATLNILKIANRLFKSLKGKSMVLQNQSLIQADLT